MYHGHAVGLQCACSAHAACTGWLENSNTSHCICGIEILGININIDMPEMYIKRCAVGLQHACSAPAAHTDWFENCYPYHCISEIEKLIINIHVDIPKNIYTTDVQSTCSVPAAHLQLAQTGQRILTHPMALVTLRNQQMTSISTYLR